MKFNTVIGNPPYNNDIYLPLVMEVDSLCTKVSCFVTPAKWHAKLSEDNEMFRLTVANRMSHIIYYPEETDVFDIRCTGGISIYLIQRHEVLDKQVDVISYRAKQFNDSRVRHIDFKRGYHQTLNNLGQEIVNKVIGNEAYFKSMGFNGLISNDNRKRYTVLFSTKVIYSGSSVTKHFYNNRGKTNVISAPRVYEVGDKNQIETDATRYIFTSDNINEIDSFVSWITCKFIRFLVLMGNVLLTGILNDEVWRFVPYTENFNMIYSDTYFYDKYSLNFEEIKLIEDTIA